MENDTRRSSIAFKEKQKKLKIVLIIFLFIFLIIFINVIKIVLQKNKEDKNITNLEDRAIEVQKQNDELKKLIKQANSETEKEEVIRNNLNMMYDGEKVIVINDKKIETEIRGNFSVKNEILKNYMLWYNYFFMKENGY